MKPDRMERMAEVQAEEIEASHAGFGKEKGNSEKHSKLRKLSGRDLETHCLMSSWELDDWPGIEDSP